MKVIFAGTPEFAASALDALISSEHQVIAVFTQPDRKAGRGKKLSISPVKQLALEKGIEVYQPLNFKDIAVKKLIKRLDADVMVVAAYGLLLPQGVLELPRFGCINIHASLLPRWRGAAPIQRAIQAGDSQTGISIMRMDVSLDTGDVMAMQSITIETNDTAGTLQEKLAQLGREMIVTSLNQLQSGEVDFVPQDEAQATYAAKLKRWESSIDWAQSGEQIIHTIHAFNPWPAATCEYQGKTIKVLRAQLFDTKALGHAGEIISVDKQLIVQTGVGQIALLECQKPGGKAMQIREFLNGFKLEPGQTLS